MRAGDRAACPRRQEQQGWTQSLALIVTAMINELLNERELTPKLMPENTFGLCEFASDRSEQVCKCAPSVLNFERGSTRHTRSPSRCQRSNRSRPDGPGSWVGAAFPGFTHDFPRAVRGLRGPAKMTPPSSRFFVELDRADHQVSIHRLAHIVDRERRDADRRQSFHLHARAPVQLHGR